MKEIFFLLASACLISELAASVINFPLEEEKSEADVSKDFDIDSHLNILYPDDRKAENLIVPFPSSVIWDSTTMTTQQTTPRQQTTTNGPWQTSTTNSPWETSTASPSPWQPTIPTTSTQRPVPTSTQRPRPPSTQRPVPTSTQRPRPPSTPRPRPPSTPRPRPGWNNPQIYDNAIRSLGPFAGRLVNVVLNKQGAQKTVQENEILYNLRSFRRPRLADEENEN